MIVTISESEIKEGAKGEYLRVKYVTDKGRESGKAIFAHMGDTDLRPKWEMCTPGARLNLKLDAQYNVIDIDPAEAPQAGTAEESPLITEAKKLDAAGEEKMTKTDWAMKDAVERKSIERQKSLALAVESQSSIGEFDPESLIIIAQRFEHYLETGK